MLKKHGEPNLKVKSQKSKVKSKEERYSSFVVRDRAWAANLEIGSQERTTWIFFNANTRIEHSLTHLRIRVHIRVV